MVRFLSAAWFELVEAVERPTDPAAGPLLVLRQVVTDTPDGEVSYRVLVSDAGATLRTGSSTEADMTFTTDYGTAAAIAQGHQSVQTALMEGRIRVSGNPGQLGPHQQRLAAVDPIPAHVRGQTTFGPDDRA